MGKLTAGPFGFVHGRIGNLVSYTLNGKNVTRIIGERTKPPTPKMLANYQRMTVVNAFLRNFVPFIKLGFAGVTEESDSNPYNAAVAYNKVHALQGAYPDIEMNYSAALVSKGDLPPAVNPSLELLPGGVEFSWEMPDDLEQCYHRNRAMLLVFFPQGLNSSGIPEAFMELSGAKRRDGSDFMELPAGYSLKTLEAYIAFIAYDRLQVSNSVWVKRPF
ncbi:DUF6266 family protein [Pedobacter faecalis]|uniref:DUF6266 family protein n=1 Tax=Pedobacter faecalis TaxID=3041495 RepID=UPI00254FBDBF|nr:DUF6266 family protein [Pedobacter sp. ELA7]